MEVLKSTGSDVLEAALVAKAALEAGGARLRRKGGLSGYAEVRASEASEASALRALKRSKRIIALGEEALLRQERTVSFAKAVEAALEARAGKRARTQSDFRYITRRFMKRCPGLAARRVRAITPQDCAGYIEAAFDTPRQRQKARLILSGVFSTARRRGWCSENPVAQVERPQVVEKAIAILEPEEITALLHTAAEYEGGKCLPAVGMMLYAGIRPHEVARLHWEQVNLQERSICILPRHSKTGGARLVTIHRPLAAILQQHRQAPEQRICPAQWPLHWRRVRCRAGWQRHSHPWTPDVLRHTFASYHLGHFRSYAELQLEMGHRDSALLRTRYVCAVPEAKTGFFWQ